MPVRIRIYSQEAIFFQSTWSCEDESLQAMLQALVDPRARDLTPEQEYTHALYAAGRYGGLIATEHGWEVAPHPEPEVRLEDLLGPPKPGKKVGLLGGLLRRKG